MSGDVQAFRLANPEPTLLRIAHDASAEVRVTAANRADGSREWLHPQGGVASIYLPAGEASLSLRALAGTSLSGYLELTGSPVSELGEGLGQEVLLPPGGAQAFRFTVTQAGPVGVGARAEPDRIECELLDAQGNRLGQGVVQMHSLKPGDYVLVLRAPASAGPVRARPAAVGIRLPPSGPPEEVIRQYLDMAKRGEGTP